MYIQSLRIKGIPLLFATIIPVPIRIRINAPRFLQYTSSLRFWIFLNFRTTTFIAFTRGGCFELSFGRCTLDSRFIDGDTLLLGEMRRFGLEEFCSEIALLDFAFVALALLTAKLLDLTLVSRVGGNCSPGLQGHVRRQQPLVIRGSPKGLSPLCLVL